MNEAQQSVLAAAADLVEAFGRHDTDAYFATFAPDATFLFHNLDRVLKGRQDYREEWALWERRDGFRVRGCRSSDQSVQIAGEVAVFIHTIETDITSGGEDVTSRERETIVFRRQGDGWIAFHEHLSVLPQ